MRTRQLFLLCLLAAACAPEAAEPISQPREAPRNVILILIDTLRADHLGSYGYSRNTSPRIDALAASGAQFMRAVSHAPNTPPSTASIMTSLYYSTHRFSGIDDRLPDALVTMAELFRDRGFATAAFVDGGYLRRVFGLDQGFDHYEDRKSGIAKITKRAEAWLERNRPDRFFLFVHCYDVHHPYEPPRPFDTMFEEVKYKGKFEPTDRNLKRVSKHTRKLNDAELRHTVALYDGGIRYADTKLGDFLDRLEARGLLESTLIVVSSDHGEEFLEHGSVLHWQQHYMPNLHVPLIFVGPGIEPRRIERTVEQIDILPTVLDLAGLPAHPVAMGRSLAPTVLGADVPDARSAYSEPFRLHLPWRTLLTDRYQLFYAPGDGRVRLYDTIRDPRAKTDLAEIRPGVVAELVKELEDRRETIGLKTQSLGSVKQDSTPDDETLEHLRALGYLDDDGAL